MNEINSPKILGIDIGTTNISFVLLEAESKKLIKAVTVKNESDNNDKTQNAEIIWQAVLSNVQLVMNDYDNITSIGITGQMHGILYIDKFGNALSPLYTWQNELGSLIFSGSETYCDEIEKRTDEKIYTGYGLSTVFYHSENGLIPKDTAYFVSIMDFVGMKLTCSDMPLVHSSVAAAEGLFDIKSHEFKKDKIKLLGISESLLPKVTNESVYIGKYKNIPVMIPIGDNQASVYGALNGDEDSVCVNYGTGSQVSLISDELLKVNGIETRPFIDNKYMLCGAALSGGRAYALIEKFFRSYVKLITNEEKEQYEYLNKLAESVNDTSLKVTTLFSGTREEPLKRGSIENISEENFTPENLILGTLKGMAGELYDFYELMGIKKNKLIASGNAVRKNKALQKILEKTFGMHLYIPEIKEEAAFGAALFSLKGK